MPPERRDGVVCPFCSKNAGVPQFTYIYFARPGDTTELPVQCSACDRTWTSAFRLNQANGGFLFTPIREGFEVPEANDRH